MIKTKGDLWKYLERVAKDYVKYGVRKHLKQAKYMHDATISTWTKGQQQLAEAILVDFINVVGLDQGLDVGLHTYHLHEED